MQLLYEFWRVSIVHDLYFSWADGTLKRRFNKIFVQYFLEKVFLWVNFADFKSTRVIVLMSMFHDLITLSMHPLHKQQIKNIFVLFAQSLLWASIAIKTRVLTYTKHSKALTIVERFKSFDYKQVNITNILENMLIL